MKKLLAGLLLVSSVLSFGAQRVPIEKVVANGDLLYIQGEQKPYSGEIERKYPSGKTLGVATWENIWILWKWKSKIRRKLCKWKSWWSGKILSSKW